MILDKFDISGDLVSQKNKIIQMFMDVIGEEDLADP